VGRARGDRLRRYLNFAALIVLLAITAWWYMRTR